MADVSTVRVLLSLNNFECDSRGQQVARFIRWVVDRCIFRFTSTLGFGFIRAQSDGFGLTFYFAMEGSGWLHSV